MQVALLRSARCLVASRSTRYVTDAGRKCREDRIEVLYDIVLAANHHAIASLQTPHAAARAHVHIVDSLWHKFLRAPDVVHVIRIAPIDEDVS
jgi:hypothetical protein